MSEVMTVVSLPGVFGSGLMEYGRLPRAEIIHRAREKAAHDKELAEKILAAPAKSFDLPGCSRQDSPKAS